MVARRGLVFLIISAAFAAPAYAQTQTQPTQQQAQAPDQCEMGVGAQAKNCSRGTDPRQSYYQTDVSCAQKRIGIVTYTAQMSVFNDAQCTWGPCNNSVPGIAHRTWPPGSKVEVCDLKTKICAEAVVMDRGPNVCLVQRTIDANPALEKALKGTGLDPATYKLLSAPGVSETSQPSGPSTVSLDAIKAAAQTQGYNTGNIPPMTYSSVNTPWGPGYLGTPIGQSSYPIYSSTLAQPSALTATPPVGNTIAYQNGTCAPQFYCSGSNVVYRSSSCVDQPYQTCSSSCSGGQCVAGGVTTATPVQSNGPSYLDQLFAVSTSSPPPPAPSSTVPLIVVSASDTVVLQVAPLNTPNPSASSSYPVQTSNETFQSGDMSNNTATNSSFGSSLFNTILATLSAALTKLAIFLSSFNGVRSP